jgi:hypothetical protein
VIPIRLVEVCPPFVPGALEPWLRLFEPTHAAAAAVLQVAREHAVELEAWGYPDRALLARHVYTAQLGFVLVSVLTAAVAACGELHRIYRRHVRGEGLSDKDYERTLLLGTSFLFSTMLVFCNVIPPDAHLAPFFPLQQCHDVDYDYMQNVQIIFSYPIY